jgi:branched-subunit amino acid aminotransferase/4-amino-4-deoxychorismate lyase
MDKGKYIWVNGSFVVADEYKISTEECNALHFSEQFRVVKTNFPFFEQTLDLIKLKFLLFNRTFSDFVTDDGAELKRQMERTLTKNKHFAGAIVNLTFRFLGKKTDYVIQTKKTEPAVFGLNEKGFFIEIFDKIQKPASSLSSIDLGSEPYWNIALSHREDSLCDQFMIVNTDDSVVEVPGANIYFIKGSHVFGPSDNSGAYIDITKQVMVKIFEKLGLDYSEPDDISVEMIKDTDEIFTVNAIEGIRWFVGFRGKRFFNNTVRKISEAFSGLAIS